MIKHIAKIVCLSIILSVNCISASSDWTGFMPPLPEGSRLHHQESADFDIYRLAAGPTESHIDERGNRIIEVPKEDILEIEGRISRSTYRGAEGSSPHGVYRYFTAWLEHAGFETIFACSPDDAGRSFPSRWYRLNPYANDYGYRNSIPISNGTLNNYMAAHKETEQGDIYLAIIITHGSVAGWQEPAFRIDVVEEKVFQFEAQEATGGFGAELQEKGFMAFYGLLFDSGSHQLKAESADTINEIVDYLNANPDERYYVTGHTDGIGRLEANMTLAKNRAESVVAALVKAGISQERLVPKGVGPLAPVATNATSEGRAENRRVEMVRITETSARTSDQAADNIGTVSDNIGTVSDNIGAASDNIGAASDKIGQAAGRIGKAVQSAGSAAASAVSGEKASGTEAPKPKKNLIPVPRVMGMWKRPAENAIKSAGFRVRSTGRNVGRVTGQSPRGEAMAEPGSTVTLTIGN